ncbi:glucose-6-phosphate dehydrogenase assembly protein OpcA [Actinoallomurus purpureus]|uniref:glucose-6-phosphate dehydrogenase assembly protein OpcA n=1 Tax=Actinoallomurus purpureus TaxID=478114 RepID=UPI0035587234
MITVPTASSEDALTAARHPDGGPAVGKVLTLMIVTTEAGQYDALRASAKASREHPSRITAVIPRGSDEATRMDAEIHVGDAGPGETLLLRLDGLLVRHAESVVLPLLVLDTPVVTRWPGFAPGSGSSPTPLGTPILSAPSSGWVRDTYLPGTPTCPGRVSPRGVRCWPPRSTGPTTRSPAR